MGLELQDLKKVGELRDRFPQGKSLLILGDCTFYFDQYRLCQVTQKICRPALKSQKVSLEEFGEVLKFERVDTVDLFGNPTIKMDLHQEPPAELLGKYDWIVDAGTMFCCFDVAKVWKNVLSMLKADGCIFHLSSLAGYLGRSYYSFSPQLFYDFYNSNGFEIVEMGTRVKPRQTSRLIGYINRILGFAGIERHPRYLEWIKINTGDFYVKRASVCQIEFTRHYCAKEPNVLPNNSLIMCFARRIMSKSFENAIPEYYRKK